jgi:hypothetical protein
MDVAHITAMQEHTDMAIRTWRNLRKLDTTRRQSFLDTELAAEERAARLSRLRHFSRYYSGDIYRFPALWAAAAGYSAGVAPPSIYVNYARCLIDRLASFSFDRATGVSLAPSGEPVGAEHPDAAGRFLAGFLHSSRLLARLTSAAREALLFGDVLLRLLHTPSSQFPLSFSLVPAEEFDFEHNPLDIAEVRFVREEFSFYDSAGALLSHREDIHDGNTVIYRDQPTQQAPPRLGAFALKPGLSAQAFSVERELPTPFSFIPAMHVRNRPRTGEKFGTSELDSLTPLLDDINWKLAQRSRNISRTMNAVIKNINGRIVTEQLDDMPIISVIGENAQLEYLTNNADLTPAAAHIADLKQALSELTGVVMLSPDKLGSVGAMSGFALSILYEPLLNAARTKRREIGGCVEDFLKMVLRAGAELGLITPAEAETAQPCINYAPDMQFTEQEKLTRLRRELLAAENNLPLTAN